MKIKIYAALLALLGISAFAGLFALVTWFFTTASDEQQKLVIAIILLSVVAVIIAALYMEFYRIAVIKLTNREQWEAYAEKELKND